KIMGNILRILILIGTLFGHIHASCTRNKLYCGRELNKMGNWKTPREEHRLYVCSRRDKNGMTVTSNRKCKVCIDGSQRDSYCYPMCDPNRRYCGHELHKMINIKPPLKDIDVDTCSTNAKNGSRASFLKECDECAGNIEIES